MLVVISIFSAFPLDFIADICPPVISSASPYLYFVFVGSVFIFIDCRLSSTITPNFSVNPSYATFMVCAPSLFGLNVLNFTWLSVSAIGVVAVPLAIIFCIFPPVKSRLSPYSYFVFAGGVNTIPFT